MSFKDEIDVFKRDALAARLKKITENQREMFRKVFPNGVSDDRLESAIALIDRTIKGNEEKEAARE